MGMLLYMMELSKNDKAAGATQKVAPKPTPEVKTKEDKPEPKKVTVSRQEIMKMNAATVRAYAEERGIENASEMSGAELKRILSDKLFEESE